MHTFTCNYYMYKGFTIRHTVMQNEEMARQCLHVHVRLLVLTTAFFCARLPVFVYFIDSSKYTSIPYFSKPWGWIFNPAPQFSRLGIQVSLTVQCLFVWAIYNYMVVFLSVFLKLVNYVNVFPCIVSCVYCTYLQCCTLPHRLSLQYHYQG